MRKKVRILTDRSLPLLALVLLATALLIRGVPSASAYSTYVANRFDKVGDASAGALTTHQVGFKYTNTSVPIGSVQIEYCSNDPFPETPCTPPAGFDASAAVLSDQTGETGYSLYSPRPQNVLILTRPSTLPAAVDSTYTFTNVLNPSVTGTYYARVTTYTSTDATGPAVEAGGIAIAVNGPLTVSTEVPPYLNFCTGITINNFDCSTASGFYVDFGELSKTSTKSATSQMVASTNAAYGYSITVSGTTFTSGNNIIPGPATPTSSVPGTSQFGINLRSNSQPGVGDDPQGPGSANVTANYAVPNKFMFVPGDSIATGTTSQDYRKYTVSYIVNISNSQPPGVYATTLTYICLANF